MLILNIKGNNAGMASYRLQKNPNSIFKRENALNFFGFYTKFEEKELEFVIANIPPGKEFSKDQTRTAMLGLEGYADPTGNIVDRYWLTQLDNCLGHLLKPSPTQPEGQGRKKDPSSNTELCGQITIEWPAIWLHHSVILNACFTELGWKLELTRLDKEAGLGDLLGDAATHGIYSIHAECEGELHVRTQQMILLTQCFTKGLRFKPDEDNIKKLLRLGGNWFKNLKLAKFAIAFFLGNNKSLEVIAAQHLGISTKEIQATTKSIEEAEQPKKAEEIIKIWVNNYQSKTEEMWINLKTDPKARNKAKRAIRQVQYLIKAGNISESNPFTVTNDESNNEKEIQVTATNYYQNKTEENLLKLTLTILKNDPGDSLHTLRHQWIAKQCLNAKAILELGANTGLCSEYLISETTTLKEITLMDKSERNIINAQYYLTKKEHNIDKRFIVGNLVYNDPRITQPKFQTQWDALILCEVIEHLPPTGLEQMTINVLRHTHTKKVIITTPNRNWNKILATDDENATEYRLNDHMFEWTPEEAKIWAEKTAKRFNKQVTIEGIGRNLEKYGSPSIGIIFS